MTKRGRPKSELTQPTQIIAIDKKTHRLLKEIANENDMTLKATVKKVVQFYEKQMLKSIAQLDDKTILQRVNNFEKYKENIDK